MDKTAGIIKSIYEHMGDSYSREIYGNRLLYSLTEDQSYIVKIISMTDEGKWFYTRLSDPAKKKVIFGAGSWGRALVRSFPNIKWECFIDNKVIHGGGYFRQYTHHGI